VCAGLYTPRQFNYITYEASSGGLNVPEATTRLSYYGISALPTLKWDGYETVEGAGSGAANGSQYIPIIEAHFLNTTPVEVLVTDYDFTPGSAFVDVKVKLYGDLATIANTKIRVALVEDHLTYGGASYYNRILRDMFPDAVGTALTIQNTGQEQTLHVPFTIAAGWDPADLLIIAWVQRDSDKFIYNSGNSNVLPFAANLTTAGGQQRINTNGSLVFGSTTVTNMGMENDVYDITLDTSALPAGWSAFFTYNGADVTSVTVPLNSFSSANLVVTINATSPAEGHVTLNVFSQGSQANVATADFLSVPGGRQVLLVADDGATTYAETFVKPSILADGRTVAVWDRAFTAVDATTLSAFDAVIWVCGSQNRGLEANDRTALDTYLANSGRIVITGQDVAGDLASEGVAAYNWFVATTHCRVLGTNSNNWTIDGVAGDPIGDGLSFAISGGDGANNQTDPDRIDLNDAIAMPVFRFGTGTLAGSRVEVNGYKLVFMAFGLEGIATQAGRDVVTANSLDWLIGPPETTPVQDTPRALTLAPNTPNPFNPLTKIAFALDRDGPVQLAVYNLQGRLVRTLVSEPMTAGDHSLVWDGRDDADQQAASGTYVYRLTADGSTLSRKMTLLK
jgi:hypothetical protein